MPAFTLQQRALPSGDWGTVPVSYTPASAPAYGAIGTRQNSNGATSRNPALPSGRTSASWLFALVGSKNNATHTSSTSGWIKLAQVNSGANWTVSLWSYNPYTPGNDPTGSVEITVSWSGSVACFGSCWRWQDVQEIGVIDHATGDTSTHTSPSINTSRVNSRVMYVDAAAANTAMGEPSTWTEHSDRGSATGATRDVIGSKAVATAGDPSGAISVTGANAAWVQWQVELMIAPPPPFTLSPSTHISASGEPTTEQLTAPGGSTFVVGRIQDDENPADNVDVEADEHTEMEWCIVATEYAVEGTTYQFRIEGLDTYSETPEWTYEGGVDTSGESQAALSSENVSASERDKDNESALALSSESTASKEAYASGESAAALQSESAAIAERTATGQSRAAIQSSSSVTKAAEVASESALALSSEGTAGPPTYATASESRLALSSESAVATERENSGESRMAITSRSSVVQPRLVSGASAMALTSSSQVSKAATVDGESRAGLDSANTVATQREISSESAVALSSRSQVGEPQFGTSGQSQLAIDSESDASAERTTQGQSAAAITSRSVVAKIITVEGESTAALDASSAASTQRDVSNESAVALDSQSDVSRPVPGVSSESQLAIDSAGAASTVRIVWSWSALALSSGGTADTERTVAGAGAMALGSRSVVSAVHETGGQSAVALRSRSEASPLTPPTPVRLPHCYAQWW